MMIRQRRFVIVFWIVVFWIVLNTNSRTFADIPATSRGILSPNLVLLGPDKSNDISSIDVSPNGKWICCWTEFEDNSGVVHNMLWICPTRGGSWVRIGEGTRHGSWKPDSSVYVYANGAEFNAPQPKLAYLSVPACKTRITDLPFSFVDKPAWNRTGQYIAVFASEVWRKGPRQGFPSGPLLTNDPQYRNLVILNAKGTIVKVCRFPGVGRVSDLSWSPDSAQLAFCEINEEGFGPPWICSIRTKLFRRAAVSALYRGIDHDQFVSNCSLWLDNAWLLCPGAILLRGESGALAIRANPPIRSDLLQVQPSFSAIVIPLMTGANQSGDSRYIVAFEEDSSTEVWEVLCQPDPKLDIFICRLDTPQFNSDLPRWVSISGDNRWVWWVTQDMKNIYGAPLH